MSARLRLSKLEKRVEEMGYEVRYEKGQFESGACVLNHKQIIIVNKFLTPEGKLEALNQVILELKQGGKEQII